MRFRMHSDLAAQVFKQTSIFTVSSAAENNESLMHQGRLVEGALREEGGSDVALLDDDEAWESDAGFWSDEDDDVQIDSKGRRLRAG